MLPVVLLALWVAILNLFRRLKLYFFGFLLGSVGLFCFAMYAGLTGLEGYLEVAVTFSVKLVGKVSGMCTAYPGYSMITVYHGLQAVSFYVDYECSGFVEMLVYLCLLFFYPVYGAGEKARYALIGTAYIFTANVLRVLVICMFLKAFGAGFMFYSHTIVARLLFFLFMVVLYYCTFTRPHILRQKVGNLSYGN